MSASPRGLSPRRILSALLRHVGRMLCLIASWLLATAQPSVAQPMPPKVYLTEEAFLADVTPYDTLGFTTINPTVPPVPDPSNPAYLHYPEMTFGPVVVTPRSTTNQSFGFHTTDNHIAVFGDELAIELIDGNALIPNLGIDLTFGLRFAFSGSAPAVTAVGAYFGAINLANNRRQRIDVVFWDGGQQSIDVVAVRGGVQANEQFIGYSSAGRAIRWAYFIQENDIFLLDNFVYGDTALTPVSRVLRLSGDLSFGGVPAGSSATRTLRINNDGDLGMPVSGITYPAGFSGDWSGVIAPGGFRDVMVTFAPPAGGAFGGAVSVAASHSSGVNTIDAAGTGIGAEAHAIALSGTLLFGNVTVGLVGHRSLRISNVGTAPLTVSGISYPQGYSGGWTGTIPSGEFRDVVVTFGPAAAAAHQGTVTVSGNHTSGTNSIAVSGTGTATPAGGSLVPLEVTGDLQFGGVPVGTFATRTVRIRNLGTTATAFAIDYVGPFSGPSLISLPAGGSEDITVTFSPTIFDPVFGFPLRDHTGIMTLRQGAVVHATIALAGTGLHAGTRLIDVTANLSFGAVLVGTQKTGTLRVENKGGDPLTISGITYPAGFSGTSLTGDIPPAGVREVTVTFAPTSDTSYAGMIEVLGNHENHLSQPWEAFYGGRVWGNAVGAFGVGMTQATRVALLSGDLAFGGVQAGARTTRTLRIRNLGSATITVTSIVYPIGFGGSWSGTIPDGGVQDVAVTFAPTAGIGYGGPIAIAGNQTLTVGSLVASGIGASRHLELSGDLAFGDVLVGTTSTRSLRIRNSGNAALTVTSIGTTGLIGSTFSGPIAAGWFQDVPVVFAPQTVGTTVNATLTVLGNHTSGTATHAASGRGTATCRTIALDPLRFDTWPAGVRLPESYLFNQGGYPPVTYAVTAGALPDGLTLLNLGPTAFYLQGIATTAGTSTYTVTARDVMGCTGQRTYTFTITGASLPASFQKLSPVQNATNQSTTQLTLLWQASNAATSYEYCIDTTDDNACGVTWVSVGNSIGATLGGLTTGTTYYWQARAVNSIGITYANGNASAFWRFATQGASTPGAPSGLVVASVAGNVVTLRWTPPAGSAPTGYVLEGGTGPGQALASFHTGSSFPIYTFNAPTGSFYVRIRALLGTVMSAASNEVRLHVGTHVAPSAPADLLSLVNGSTIGLTWKNTFGGGAPTSLMLDVTGSAIASLPVGPGDAVSFAGVPAGNYTVSLRAVNAAGTSPASNQVILNVPGPCTGPPLTPMGFLGYRMGNTVFVDWAPASAGPAPTGYALNVTGSYVGVVTTSGRAISGTVGPGSYTLTVAATNACGSSAASSPQTVVVP